MIGRMSLDLQVFGSSKLLPAEFVAICTGIEGMRLVGDTSTTPNQFVLERLLRGKYDYVATIDGPLAVEPEDLPDVVSSRTVGVTVTYQLVVEGSAAPSFKIASRVAAEMAASIRGVVYDPQLDDVTWPKGGTRAFRPPAATTVDSVEYRWYVRREDMAPEIGRRAFEVIRRLLPEALPRRFGGYEPLQFKLDVGGPDAFFDQWRRESYLFWKGNRPCFGGHTSGLSDDLEYPQLPHPVGSVSLTFDSRAFDDERWRLDLVTLFCTMIAETASFCAVAEVTRNLRFAGGSTSHGPDTEARFASIIRGEWQGLPPDPPWLIWTGSLYESSVGPHLDGSATRVNDGLLLRLSEHPTIPDSPPTATRRFFRRIADGPAAADAAYRRIPSELQMVVSAPPGRGGRRTRATLIPEGL